MERICTEDLPALFESVSAVMNEKAAELGELDARMGDGDLGLTMGKGFAALPDIARAVSEADIGKKLMMIGMKMTSVVPSTMGTLMGSGLMSGGKAVTGRKYLDAEGYTVFLKGFAEGIAKRGKCARGDRTVLDAVGTAADRAAEFLATDASLPGVAGAALKGAEDGTEATRAMTPKFGKAAVHAAAADGVRDQGACAGLYMLQGYYNFIRLDGKCG